VIHPTINEVLVKAFFELEHPYHTPEADVKEKDGAIMKKGN
jgi:hypothetical protein